MSKSFAISLTIVAVFATLGIVALFNVFSQNSGGIQKHKITIGGAGVFVDVVSTAEARTKGLSGRDILLENEGMLFIFDSSKKHAIWMKDMRFPIDIIWIDERFSIVGVTENILPSSFPEIFEPSEPVRFVIEVNAGWSYKNGIRQGMLAEFPKYLLHTF